MKKTTRLPFEIHGTECGVLEVSIKVHDNMLPRLSLAGLSGEELNNYLTARLQDAVQALDGSVDGLIVSDLEHL